MSNREQYLKRILQLATLSLSLIFVTACDEEEVPVVPVAPPQLEQPAPQGPNGGGSGAGGSGNQPTHVFSQEELAVYDAYDFDPDQINEPVVTWWETIRTSSSGGAGSFQHGHPIAPLLLAVKKDDINAVRVFLANPNVDVNVSWISYGHTALHLAVSAGNEDIVRLLLEHPDVDPSISSRIKNAPIHFALLGKVSFNIIKSLVDHPLTDLLARNIDGKSAQNILMHHDYQHPRKAEIVSIFNCKITYSEEFCPGRNNE